MIAANIGATVAKIGNRNGVGAAGIRGAEIRVLGFSIAVTGQADHAHEEHGGAAPK
jgi:hypothetical protein